MPRTTDLHQYPKEFEQLLVQAAATTTPLFFSFPEARLTMRFRHRFYSYMKLLRDSRVRPDLIAAATSVRLVLAQDHLGLSFAPEHDSWEGVLIRSVLQLQIVPPVVENGPIAVADAKAKLAEIRARGWKV